MDCVAQCCRQPHMEAFRTDSIERVLERAEQFFNLMPRLKEAKSGAGAPGDSAHNLSPNLSSVTFCAKSTTYAHFLALTA